MVAFKHKVKLILLGWLANPVCLFFFVFFSNKVKNFQKKLGTLRNNYFLPKLLVTYGSGGIVKP